MLEKIKLENYRGYDEHEIEFKNLTIAVGKNNAGKSTLIEALRLLSLVTNRYQSAPYRNVPEWLKIGLFNKGISPSLQRIDFSYDNIFFGYNEPPAIITAEFSNKTKIKVYFAGEKKIHAVLFDEHGVVCAKSKLDHLELPVINILPQISPLIPDEKVLNEDYVKSNIESPTSSRHFRNQLNYFKQYYPKFKELIESTWEGLMIKEYYPGDRFSEKDPFLIIREEEFAAEVSYMGHGLQMWMQTMWFLARCNANSTIVLDEPDVYMHADLQRKLIRLLKNEFSQIIIATHSIEIMSEVEPDNVLVIDRKKSKSIFTTDFTAVQKLLLNIGSIHNIALARLWSAKKILIVEGKDIDILKRIHNTLYPNSIESLAVIPQISIGGWGGWNRAIGTKLMLKNAGDESIITYCIFDRDYHTDEEIKERYEEAEKNSINLKIWAKKEIENYLIVPTAILRIIEKEKGIRLTEEVIVSKIEEFCQELKDEYLDCLTDKIHVNHRRSGKFVEPSTARKLAMEQLENEWQNRLHIISGKTLIKKISNWTNNTFNVSLSANKLAQEIHQSEINPELKEVISRIENKKSF
jgi:energy-coupling factor transporter ATP-binding protein EcfA2